MLNMSKSFTNNSIEDTGIGVAKGPFLRRGSTCQLLVNNNLYHCIIHPPLFFNHSAPLRSKIMFCIFDFGIGIIQERQVCNAVCCRLLLSTAMGLQLWNHVFILCKDLYISSSVFGIVL